MIGLIVAYAKNRTIGYKGRIPWNIKGEQKRFRELTTGNVVIMGRKSYEEIGKPLSNRYTIVVYRDCFISGGAGLYKEAIPIVDKKLVL